MADVSRLYVLDCGPDVEGVELGDEVLVDPGVTSAVGVEDRDDLALIRDEYIIALIERKADDEPRTEAN